MQVEFAFFLFEYLSVRKMAARNPALLLLCLANVEWNIQDEKLDPFDCLLRHSTILTTEIASLENRPSLSFAVILMERLPSTWPSSYWTSSVESRIF